MWEGGELAHLYIRAAVESQLCMRLLHQGFQLGLIAFTSAVFGGIGNLPGAVLGALLIGLIQAFNEGLNWHAPGSDWTQSIVFSILILILVFRPEGLLGERTPEGA